MKKKELRKRIENLENEVRWLRSEISRLISAYEQPIQPIQQIQPMQPTHPLPGFPPTGPTCTVRTPELGPNMEVRI
jgi:hypothetical protein